MAIAYQPRFRVTGSPTWINFGPQITTAPFTVTVTGLSQGTGYDFDVLAINNFGSTASSTVTATTSLPPPVESIEGFTVTTAGPIIEASQTMGVADPSGPYNTFVLQASTGTPPFVVSRNGGAGAEPNTVSLVYHNHTTFVQTTTTWAYWNTTSSVYTPYHITSVNLSNTSLAASQPASTVVGSVSTVMSDGSTFVGTYTVSDTTNFKIIGASLETNLANLSGNYPITITAVPSSIVGNAFTTATITIVAASASIPRRSGTRFPYPTAAYTVPPWPYAYNSVWNIGIGSGALFTGPSGSDPCTASLLSQTPQLGTPAQWDYPLYVGASSDTVFSVSWNAWAGDTSSPPVSTVHVPSNAAVSNDSDAIVLLMDSSNPTFFAEFNNTGSINRSTNVVAGGSGGNGGGTSLWDTSGNGVAAYGQGNSHVPLVGADLDNIAAGGGVYRMLPCHLFGSQQKPWGPVSGWPNNNHYNCVWPAKASDYDGGTGSGGGGYTGLVPFGSTIFIPPSVLNMSTWSFGGTNPLGLTQGGMAIALQLQNYGWHDENTGGSFLLYTSWDVTTTSPRTTTYNQISAALTTLKPYLRVMQNWMIGLSPGVNPSGPPGNGYQYDPVWNPNAPVNGGGTYPLAPPYWDSSLPTTFTSQNTY